MCNTLFYICEMPAVLPDKLTVTDTTIVLHLFMLPSGHLTNSSHFPVARLFFLLSEAEIHNASFRRMLALRIFFPSRIP